MTRQDVIKLFDLLEELYHGQRRPRTERILAIWATVLGPWSYAEVRDAVISRARAHRHFPDPSEIVEFLPSLEADKAAVPLECSDNILAKFCEQAEAIQEKYHARSMPTPSEAKKCGISYADWCEMVDKDEACMVGRAAGG